MLQRRCLSEIGDCPLACGAAERWPRWPHKRLVIEWLLPPFLSPPPLPLAPLSFSPSPPLSPSSSVFSRPLSFSRFFSHTRRQYKKSLAMPTSTASCGASSWPARSPSSLPSISKRRLRPSTSCPSSARCAHVLQWHSSLMVVWRWRNFQQRDTIASTAFCAKISKIRPPGMRVTAVEANVSLHTS